MVGAKLPSSENPVGPESGDVVISLHFRVCNVTEMLLLIPKGERILGREITSLIIARFCVTSFNNKGWLEISNAIAGRAGQGWYWVSEHITRYLTAVGRTGDYW